MASVNIVTLMLTSLKAVGSIAIQTMAGAIMAKMGIITNDGKKVLGELYMNLLLPCLMFTQVIYCHGHGSANDPCPDMERVIQHSLFIFFWPILIVGSGYLLGLLAAKILRVSPDFERAAAGSVAFGSATTMPVALLQMLSPALYANGFLESDPLLFLPVYLVLAPVLQWTAGSYIFIGNRTSGPQVPLEDGSTRSASDEPVDESTNGESDESSTDEDSEESREWSRAWTWHVRARNSRRASKFMSRRAKTSHGLFADVHPGFSAQAEVDDVLQKEDLAMPGRGAGCLAKAKHLCFLFSSPPVLATLVGIVVACIRPIQNQFLDVHDGSLTNTHALHWIYLSLRQLGDAAVPVNLLMLGAGLSKGADFSTLPMTTALVLTVTKMLIQPALVAGFVSLCSHLTGSTLKGKWLVAMVVSLTPTATNIMVQVELGGQNKAAMSTLIFIQYLLSPLLMTVTLTASATLLQTDGFLA
ncbi:unnamed protein product [Symbiodinium microadriaticum]|nr:unnamed protein product [Symbiodinium microadriaticum]